ncbi:glycosyltransferase family 2 protein [Pedobacter sp. G11]|uniref:glycosyltransferase family 2 protein n=1 Tax=Pedobacter sp. G11 TaxID=2482728 RepID=UPI00143DB13E|nr:glycosyltransferase family 2 protein [Pedobacter sp. G11]
MDSILVSFCIPAFNCSDYIHQTLTSICRQTHANLEIVIVNDGSTDDTADKISKIDDHRIKLIQSKNLGAANARNTAFENSSGKYIIFFDADDIIAPNFVEKQLQWMDSCNNNVVLSGWGRFYADDIKTFVAEEIPEGGIYFEAWINDYWYNCNPMTTPGRIMIPRNIIDESGRWDSELTLNDDLEFFTRVFLQAEKIVFNPSAMFYYRSGINGLSGKKGSKAYYSLYVSIVKSVDDVLTAFPDHPKIKQSCANMLQSGIYEIYPSERHLIKKMELKIKILGGSELKPNAGGITKYLNHIFGWKLVRVVKRFLKLEN